jgi:predicted dehydrogenase
MSDTQRTVLVVGCGSIGRRHIRLLNERSDTTVWACDRDPEIMADAMAKAPAARTFAKLDDALTEHPDFVWVCTPDQAHAPVAVAAMRAGAHVFCEKPLSDTVDGAIEISEAAKSTGRLVGVGYILRCEDGFQCIRQMIDDGKLGTLLSASARIGAYDTLLFSKTDFMIARKDSLVLDYSHEIDYLLWYFGPVAEVTATAACIGDLAKKAAPNVVDATMRFANGAVVGLHMDYIQLPGRRSLELYGDGGRLSYTPGTGVIHYEEHGADAITDIPVTGERDDWFRREHQLFFEAVDAEQQPLVSAADSLATLRVATAIITAYREKRVVVVA